MQIRTIILQIPQNFHLLWPLGSTEESGFSMIFVKVAADLMAKSKQHKCRLKAASTCLNSRQKDSLSAGAGE